MISDNFGYPLQGTVLKLSRSHLKFLDHNLFSKNLRIETIHFYGNKLTHMNSSMFDHLNLRSIYLNFGSNVCTGSSFTKPHKSELEYGLKNCTLNYENERSKRQITDDLSDRYDQLDGKIDDLYSGFDYKLTVMKNKIQENFMLINNGLQEVLNKYYGKN
jgi:hypothetical protein